MEYQWVDDFYNRQSDIPGWFYLVKDILSEVGRHLRVCHLLDCISIAFYKIDYRNAKNASGVWEKVPYYTVDDTIPYGHGEKSVMMLTEYIKLTPEEKYAIRWHMGFSEPRELYSTLGQAMKKYPLILLLNEADMEVTYFFNI